ncbi:hypothetical protein CHARACLAT_005703 [Characodon lateralis]|uniref:Uncharacterized protein n=1 Tax=Characodon lateralis TaxID=208331 RepID=A0ABU7DQG6_9TELE|nr:hypothetical protein [Characodon lateralis]
MTVHSYKLLITSFTGLLVTAVVKRFVARWDELRKGMTDRLHRRLLDASSSPVHQSVVSDLQDPIGNRHLHTFAFRKKEEKNPPFDSSHNNVLKSSLKLLSLVNHIIC